MQDRMQAECRLRRTTRDPPNDKLRGNPSHTASEHRCTQSSQSEGSAAGWHASHRVGWRQMIADMAGATRSPRPPTQNSPFPPASTCRWCCAGSLHDENEEMEEGRDPNRTDPQPASHHQLTATLPPPSYSGPPPLALLGCAVRPHAGPESEGCSTGPSGLGTRHSRQTCPILPVATILPGRCNPIGPLGSPWGRPLDRRVLPIQSARAVVFDEVHVGSLDLPCGLAQCGRVHPLRIIDGWQLAGWGCVSRASFGPGPPPASSSCT